MIDQKIKIPWIYHPDYDVPLPYNHRFSSTKFGDLYSFLIKTKISSHSEIFKPIPATRKQLERVHTKHYINKIEFGTLTKSEERILGLPWSKTLLKRSYLAINGTLNTAYLALERGVACHLAGGTHHAHANYGSGFCVFNDIAFAAKNLIADNICKKILIIDCDVHQGDGTATICADDVNIFTCSIHARGNFPINKAKGDLDVALEDNIEMNEYIEKIISTLYFCEEKISPDLIIYDAGIDVHINDELGRLKIDSNYIMKRDVEVLKFYKQRSIPIATVIGGGYSRNRIELAERHAIIFYAANNVYSTK